MQLVHKLVEEQAHRTPDAIAVQWGKQTSTYAELNAHANQLARELRSRQVGPETRVAICTGRNPNMALGILGILKAGGIYVPLDAEYPSSRLSYMIKDSQAALLLCDSHMDLDVQSIQRIELDREMPRFLTYPDGNLKIPIEDTNGCYIIYTSGSTGEPKGVTVTHAGAVNLALAQRQLFGLTSVDAVLQFSSPGFDAAAWEWLLALASGARLVFAKDVVKLAGTELLRTLQEDKVSVLTIPPSALASIVPESLPTLRVLIVAGEACAPDLAVRWASGRRMFNAYGPTEATVCATISRPLATDGDCPIGRPIANAEIYVLDTKMEPVPVGMAGEIYIGGRGLARGYLNRPDLTAQHFLPHPFSREAGERLYSTGDVGRWRDDGTLEFLGRIDEQIKIRGFRIELGEIEASLRSVPGVAQAAVTLREDIPGEKRLVAYVVTRCDKEPSRTINISDLREEIRQKLPDHMVPEAFVFLADLPTTASGKLDRKALPAPDRERPMLAHAYQAPCSPTQEVLVGIWREVLNIEKIGVRDNFFELGGHSLLLTTLGWRIAEQFGVELSLRDMLQVLTIEKMSSLISQRLIPAQPSADARALLKEVSQMSMANLANHKVTARKSD